MKPLADPSNLESNVPAVQAAAKVKQQQDEAEQTIKAVRFLVDQGCGCNDADGSITKALLEAMNNCIEPVRFEAVQGIAKLATQEECQLCGGKRCCKPEIYSKLVQLAYAQDESGCWKEPSPRVRRKAIIALEACPSEYCSNTSTPSATGPAAEPLPPPVPDREYPPEETPGRERAPDSVADDPSSRPVKQARRVEWSPNRPAQR